MPKKKQPSHGQRESRASKTVFDAFAWYFVAFSCCQFLSLSLFFYLFPYSLSLSFDFHANFPFCKMLIRLHLAFSILFQTFAADSFHLYLAACRCVFNLYPLKNTCILHWEIINGWTLHVNVITMTKTKTIQTITLTTEPKWNAANLVAVQHF